MNKPHVFPRLDIPTTVTAGPGPGNTDRRVLDRFVNAGVSDHMQADVLRGLIECKLMLRQIWQTANVYTFGVAGTGWSAIDCMLGAVLPGDKVVAFVNGTFSGIACQTIRMKAATRAELAGCPLNPDCESVAVIEIPIGESFDGPTVRNALKEHQPKWAFMAHWETGSGRINDIRGFSDACEEFGVMGLVDAVSSLGIADFSIDDYAGVVGWASCPQKGLHCLPQTYAPVSFTDAYIATLKADGSYSYVHNPILEARHWGIVDGTDVEVGTYHRTHSSHAVAAFHESLRLLLLHGQTEKAEDYAFCESVLRSALEEIGCEVTSNMTSLIVLNLPKDLQGREKELVQNCRAKGFGIWTTLSEPVQVRVGFLNQLGRSDIFRIADRFAESLKEMGADIDLDEVQASLARKWTGKGERLRTDVDGVA